MTNYLVQKTVKGETKPAESDWLTISVYGNASSARTEIAQLRGQYARKGYLLRMVVSD